MLLVLQQSDELKGSARLSINGSIFYASHELERKGLPMYLNLYVIRKCILVVVVSVFCFVMDDFLLYVFVKEAVTATRICICL